MKKFKVALTILTLFTLVGCDDNISSSGLDSSYSSTTDEETPDTPVTPTVTKYALDTTFATKLKTSIKSLASVTAISETLSDTSFEASVDGAYTKTYLTKDGVTDTSKGTNGVETIADGTAEAKISDVSFKQAYSGFDKTDSKDLAASIAFNADYNLKYSLKNYYSQDPETKQPVVQSAEYTKDDLDAALYLDNNVIYADLADETIHSGLVYVVKTIVQEYIESTQEGDTPTDPDEDYDATPTDLDDEGEDEPASIEEFAQKIAESMTPNYASFNLANKYIDVTEMINQNLPLTKMITMDTEAVDEYIDSFMDIYKSLTTINSLLTYSSDETYTYLYANLTTNVLRLIPSAVKTYVSSLESVDEDTKETVDEVCGYVSTIFNATTIKTFDITVAFNDSGIAYINGDIDMSIANYKQEVEYVEDAASATYLKKFIEVKSGKIALKFKDTYAYNSEVTVDKHGEHEYTELSEMLPLIIGFLG